MTILSDRVKLNKKQQEKPYKKNKIVQGLFIRCGRAKFADAVYSV